MIDAVNHDPIVSRDSLGLRRKVRLFCFTLCSVSRLLLISRTPCQIFTLFFSHLTTSITAIDVYLTKNPTLRDHVPPDLADFGTLYDNTLKSQGLAEEANIASGQGPESEAATLVRSLNFTLTQYVHEWGANLNAMGRKSFEREHRTSDRKGERMLVMSGLTWNPKSQSKRRDWHNVVSAITLETGLVDSYRGALLEACPGACAIREEMLVYLRSISMPYYITDPVTSEPKKTQDWMFPDGIAHTVSTSGNRPYDPDLLRKEHNAAKATDAMITGKRDGVHTLIEGLRKNKLLWSSDSDAKKGTLETLAHHCLEALAHVSHTSTLACVSSCLNI